MNKLKRILFLFVAVIMTFSLVACGNKNNKEDDIIDNEQVNTEETGDIVPDNTNDDVAIVDLADVTFKIPRDIYNALEKYNGFYEEDNEINNENYYMDCWDNYIEIIKGDASEMFIIENNESSDEKMFPDLKLESVQEILKKDVSYGIELEEIIVEDLNKVIFSADVSVKIGSLVGEEEKTFSGNGYVIIISEDDRELFGIFVAENTDETNNKKLFEIANSVEFVDYEKYKINKEKINDVERFTKIKIMDDFELTIPEIAYDYRVNVFGFLYAIENELIKNEENTTYWLIDERADYFTLAPANMEAVILIDMLEYGFPTIDKIDVSNIEEILEMNLDFSDFHGEKIINDSNKKIFKVSFHSTEEGLFDEIVEIDFYGYVGIYDIDGVTRYIITLCDEEDNTWTLKVAESMKKFE